MGREVKRVPLDFDWPLEEVWEGYLSKDPPEDPPAGDGWQMWETCSDGSPISPVFNTPEELAHWLADTGAPSFGSQTSSYESWLRMIVGDGWAPSMVIDNGVCKSGVDFVAKARN